MMRHASTEQWLRSSSRALAASGVLGMIRRRSLQLLLASSLDDEVSAHGPRPSAVEPEIASARSVLLQAWAAAELARRTLDGEVSSR